MFARKMLLQSLLQFSAAQPVLSLPNSWKGSSFGAKETAHMNKDSQVILHTPEGFRYITRDAIPCVMPIAYMWPLTQNNPSTPARDIQTKPKRDIVAGALKQGAKLGTKETATPNCESHMSQRDLSQRPSEGRNHALWLYHKDNAIWEWNTSSNICWENAWKHWPSRHLILPEAKPGALLIQQNKRHPTLKQVHKCRGSEQRLWHFCK